MNKKIIKDNFDSNFQIKNINDFYNHILNFHSTGTSIHEEDGHYFTVDDEFREKIKNLFENSNN